MQRVLTLSAALMLPLAGCAPALQTAAAAPAVVVVEPEPTEPWRGIANAEDAGKIDRVNEAWAAALAEARSRGFKGKIAAEGELLVPTAALPRPAPPPGPYYCRVIKLGRQGRRGPVFNAYKPFYCYVEAQGELLSIVKQTGSQRPAGRIYPDSREERLIFLGSMSLGDEQNPLPYGEQRDRDMVGVVERVAPFRYRLVIPWPKTESKLDVIELMPVTDGPPEDVS